MFFNYSLSKIVSIYMTLGDASVYPSLISMIPNCTLLMTQGIIEFVCTRSHPEQVCYMIKELLMMLGAQGPEEIRRQLGQSHNYSLCFVLMHDDMIGSTCFCSCFLIK